MIDNLDHITADNFNNLEVDLDEEILKENVDLEKEKSKTVFDAKGNEEAAAE